MTHAGVRGAVLYKYSRDPRGPAPSRRGRKGLHSPATAKERLAAKFVQKYAYFTLVQAEKSFFFSHPCGKKAQLDGAARFCSNV